MQRVNRKFSVFHPTLRRGHFSPYLQHMIVTKTSKNVNMSLDRFHVFVSLDTDSQNPFLRVIRALKHVFSLDFKTAFPLFD